jgi:hypothetical protein
MKELILPIDETGIKKAIESIDRCEAKIHRIQLSSKHYDYPIIKQKIGKINIDETFVPEDEMPNYDRKGIKQLPEGPLTIYFNPVEPYLPWCVMKFSYPTKDFLIKMNNLFPGMVVSSIEYANDIFCKTTKEVRSLYYAMRQYLYFPYKRNAIELTPHSLTVGSKKLVNNVWRYNNKMKLYERGADDLKNGDHWKIQDVDRIRMEFIATVYYLDNPRIKYLPIRYLPKFIQNSPQFERMMERKFIFKRFKQEKYYEKINCVGNSFQERYLYYKSRIKNISQYTEEVEKWNPLKRIMIKAMKKFDHNWK